MQQRFFKLDPADNPDAAKTTEIGSSASVSPRTAEQARLFVERYDRRSVISDVEKMQADNPLIAEAHQMFVDTAVSKGFTCTVERTAGRGTKAGLQNRAQREIDRIVKDLNMRRKIPSWGKMFLLHGDCFLQNIEVGGQLVNVKAMPTVSMERNSDDRDVFPDVFHAYHQVDVGSNEEIARFALWQITHGRWNFRDGQRYGSSQYLQIRTMSRLFLQMLGDQAVRRATRGPMRLEHSIGTPEHPGNETDVSTYLKNNSLTELANRDSLKITTDFFHNGMAKVTALQGDQKLSDIEDIQFMLNCLFPRTMMAKGLIGFGENVSRDILDEQQQFLFTAQDLLIDVLEYDAMRPTFDIGLLFAGIDPDSVTYTIQFEERMSELGKLARMEVLLECYEAGVMTEKQLITRAAPYLVVKNVDEYIEELESMRAKKQADALQQAAGPDAGGAEALQKSAQGEPSAIGKSNVRRFASRLK
jgi:hypothetical protein